MTRVGWNNEAWEQIPDYGLFWAPFDSRFKFRPGMSPETWPAIEEPPGSSTFDLSQVFARDDAGFAADEYCVNEQALEAFVEVFDPGTRLVALDWQHSSYWFSPHRHQASSDFWRVPPFPNGDYFIIVTEDLSQGTFGHPWEQTLCVWGDALVASLSARLSTWLPLKRSASA